MHCAPVASLSVLLFASSLLELRSARLSPQIHLHAQERDPVEEIDETPPLDGCQTNFFDKTCCCFVDAGILKQSQCTCKGSASSCERKLKLSYSPKPAREISFNGTVAELYRFKWSDMAKGGYISGFQAVDQNYCMAAPVVDPQVDSHEREYDCTCSTPMGNNVEMQCGSSCAASACHKSNPKVNRMKDFWSPFKDGRGRCCTSSYSSQTEGCPQILAPITEKRAKTIVTEALTHAASGDKKAFLIKTSEDLVEDMTSSFVSAKEKKMATSRSGAQFFFSGDYAYILKSINPSEYDVLAKLARFGLIHHLQNFATNDESLQAGEYCTAMFIQHYAPPIWKDFKDTPEWKLARKVLTTGGTDEESFFGYWNYDEKKSMILESTVYVHAREKHLAYWCNVAGAWRVQINKLDAIDYSECEDRQRDPLFKFIQSRLFFRTSTDPVFTEEHVEVVYNDFIESFRSKTTGDYTTNVITSRCTNYWRPATLINQFIMGFEYKANPWMVIKNSVTAVQRELERFGFKEYQSNDLFDVKPFPIHSDERPVLFKMQFTKDFMVSWRNWDGVRENLKRDLSFMDTALSNEMVDYSMMINAFYINDERLVLDTIPFPNCVERPLRDVHVISNAAPGHLGDYGDAPGSILVCFSIIDMLMEFTVKKVPENLVLLNKWSDWSDKIMQLFDCLGHPKPIPSLKCSSYTALRNNFIGVDIPSIRSALAKDVSPVFNAENEVGLRDRDTGLISTWKCCCDEKVCKMVDTSTKKEWYPGKKLVELASGVALNSKGCGSLVGKGWHSYWRGPKKCVLPTDIANKVFDTVVLSEADGWV